MIANTNPGSDVKERNSEIHISIIDGHPFAPWKEMSGYPPGNDVPRDLMVPGNVVLSVRLSGEEAGTWIVEEVISS